MKTDKEQATENVADSSPKKNRQREFETPSQRHNRDGDGRKQSGSEGTLKKSISNNH